MHVISLPAKLKQVDLNSWAVRLGIMGAVILGALHAWAASTSYSMNADGISYLDIGDAYWRGDWEAAINAVWSPLYSWILGGVMRLLQPAMRWEFPLVHAVNFALYLLSLACFAYFWRQVTEFRRLRLASERNGRYISFPDWAFNAVGYLLFMWCSLTLIEIWAVTPDMLMAAIVYLAAGILLRMRMQVSGYGTYALFGFLLGLSYLAKSIMLPVSFLILGVSLLNPGGFRRVFPRFLMSLIVFLLVAGPYITLISLARGKFTIGESGTITYLRHVNRLPFPHWQGEQDDAELPAHPSRQIFTNPPIYEFGNPIGGTYPISYDPSYWYEGAKPSYRMVELIPSFLSNMLVYFDIFFNKLGAFMAGILILYIFAVRQHSAPFETARNWNLALISVLVLVLYSLVFVEGRYIAIFIVLLLADFLANLSLADQAGNKRLVTAASVIMILSLFSNLVASNFEGYARLAARSNTQAAIQSAVPPSWPGVVAQELQLLGILPGDEVAVIGYAYDSFWARLARVKIVAEMLDVDANPFWYGNAELQAKVIKAFQDTGAKAIVAEEVPDQALLSTWHQVGNTNVYIYLFDG